MYSGISCRVDVVDHFVKIIDVLGVESILRNFCKHVKAVLNRRSHVQVFRTKVVVDDLQVTQITSRI